MNPARTRANKRRCFMGGYYHAPRDPAPSHAAHIGLLHAAASLWKLRRVSHATGRLSLESGALAAFKQTFRIEAAEEMYERRGQATPTGLVARSDTGAVIAMEIFVKQRIIAPVGIVLECFRTAKNRPPAILVTSENAGEAPSDLGGDLEQIHLAAGACRKLHFERVSVVAVKTQQRSKEDGIEGHPDGTAPVRISPEKARIRFGGQVRDAVILSMHVKDVGMIQVVARQRTNAIGAQKLVLIEHPAENSSETIRAYKRQYAAVTIAQCSRARRMDRIAQLRYLPEAFKDVGRHFRHALALPWLDHGRRSERKQTDHRPNLQPLGTSIRQAEDIVIEPVRFIPHSFRSHAIQRVGDQHEVIHESCGDVLIGRALCRDLNRDLKHVLAVHRHPSGSIRLLEITSRRQRG